MIERQLKLCLSAVCCLLLCGSIAFGQRQITGKVTDADTGDPLIGASISVTGTTNGTISDINGSYRLNVSTDAPSLRIAYTGYAEQTIIA